MRNLKSLKWLMALALPMLVTFNSCSSDDDDNKAPFIELADASQGSIVLAEGGQSIVVNIKSNRSWTVSVPANNWLTVTPLEGNNNGSFTVSAESNAGNPPKSAINLTISTSTGASINVAVSQAGEGADVGDIPQTVVTSFVEFFVGAENNKVFDSDNWAFSTTSPGYPADPYQGFHTRVFAEGNNLSIAPYNSTSSSVTAYAVMTPFNVSAATNKTLEFEETVFWQTADASKFELVVSTDLVNDPNTATWEVVQDLTIAAEDANKNVWVDRTVDLSKYASETKAWFAFRFIGKANTYRVANIYFSADENTPIFFVNTAAQSIAAAGGEIEIPVTGNVAWTAEVTSGAAYVSDITTSGNGDDPVVVTLAQNGTADPRDIVVKVSTTAEVPRKDYEVTITQNGATLMNVTLVTNLSQVVAGKYIIAHEYVGSATNPLAPELVGKYFALPNEATDATNPIATQIDAMTNGAQTIDSNLIWEFTGNNTDGFVVSYDGKSWLTSTNAAQGITTSSTESSQKWVVQDASDVDGFVLVSPAVGSRYLSLYMTAQGVGSFRYYNASNYVSEMKLYKLD